MEQKVNWELIETHSIENRSNFWKAIFLSVTKPHLINRRLAGAEQISLYRSKRNDPTFIDRVAQIAQETFPDELDEENILPKILNETKAMAALHKIDLQSASKYDLNEEKLVIVILNKLLPKNLASNKITYEIAIIGKGNFPDLIFFFANSFAMISLYIIRHRYYE